MRAELAKYLLESDLAPRLAPYLLDAALDGRAHELGYLKKAVYDAFGPSTP